MPLHWTISHADKRVLIRTEGVVGLKDVEAYLDDLVTHGAMAYGKLFDASDLVPSASDHDLLMLAARMRAYAATLPNGPIAFVVTKADARAIVDRYINLAQAPRAVGVFATADEARRWLDTQR